MEFQPHTFKVKSYFSNCFESIILEFFEEVDTLLPTKEQGCQVEISICPFLFLTEDANERNC